MKNKTRSRQGAIYFSFIMASFSPPVRYPPCLITYLTVHMSYVLGVVMLVVTFSFRYVYAHILYTPPLQEEIQDVLYILPTHSIVRLTTALFPGLLPYPPLYPTRGIICSYLYPAAQGCLAGYLDQVSYRAYLTYPPCIERHGCVAARYRFV